MSTLAVFFSYRSNCDSHISVIVLLFQFICTQAQVDILLRLCFALSGEKVCYTFWRFPQDVIIKNNTI